MWIWYILTPSLEQGGVWWVDTGPFTNEFCHPMSKSECEWRVPNAPGDWSTDD